MFAETIRRAVMAAARTELPTLAGGIWKAFAAGAVTEAEASELAELVEARKVIPVERPAIPRVGSRPRTPASLQRRRRWVASGAMPPNLAVSFSAAEAAALAVVAAEVTARGDCRLHVGAIAALAGISETSVRNALRQARRLGLIEVKERRVSRQRNLSNIVQIVSREWCTWLRLGATGTGCKFALGTYSSINNRSRNNTAIRSSQSPVERRGQFRAPSGARDRETAS